MAQTIASRKEIYVKLVHRLNQNPIKFPQMVFVGPGSDPAWYSQPPASVPLAGTEAGPTTVGKVHLKNGAKKQKLLTYLYGHYNVFNTTPSLLLFKIRKTMLSV